MSDDEDQTLTGVERPYLLPVPTPQPETDDYWERAREHELWLMHCDDCSSTYFYPRPICPNCFSRNTRWRQSTGRGTLYAFAVVHRPPRPAFAESVPYVVALVELEGGARMPTNLVDVAPDPGAIRIGMEVEVVFDDVTPEVTLPKFRPVQD
jgi:uncharacterized protein